MCLNSKISYLYRDSDNYKIHNECVINGLLSPEQQQMILDCLNEGEWFIPKAVGLPEKRFPDWDPQSDHPWFELGEYSFEATDVDPTVNITPAMLVAAFESCKDHWREIEYEAMRSLDPFSVAELIQEASQRSEEQNGLSHPGKTNLCLE